MTPQAIAELAARTMYDNDRSSQRLGVELVEIAPGHATMAMVVRDDMINGHDLAHGGYIYTLADTAFAYACNSNGASHVSAQCQITYLRPAKLGDRLIAMARTVSKSGRSGLTDVTVSVGEHVVAEFRGYARTVDGWFLPVPRPHG